MSLPGYIEARGDLVWLSVKVQPRSSKNAVGEALGNELKVKVTAPPVDAAANEMLVRFLAEVLDCPRNQIVLMHGHASRHKQLTIKGMGAEVVAAKLKEMK